MPVYGGGGGGGRKSNALLIIGLLCCCCIIIPLIIYGSLWGTNTICDKTNPDDQPWLGMNCASVYDASLSPAPATRTPAPATGTPAPSPSNPCAGLTPTSLAKDVPVSCLQKTWTDAGCSVTGTVYPVSGYKGWWNSSPGGLATTVYCSGAQVSGDASGNCGAGNYGAIIADMNLWATSTTPGSVTEQSRVPGCRGPQS